MTELARVFSAAMTKGQFFAGCNSWKGDILRAMVPRQSYAHESFHMGIGMQSAIRHDLMRFGIQAAKIDRLDLTRATD